jgi:undecaprenyl pyrophosphate phosphatase UppP
VKELKEQEKFTKEQRMNIRKFVFGLIITLSMIPTIIVGFLYKVIISAFQVGIDYAVQLALWVEKRD